MKPKHLYTVRHQGVCVCVCVCVSFWAAVDVREGCASRVITMGQHPPLLSQTQFYYSVLIQAEIWALLILDVKLPQKVQYRGHCGVSEGAGYVI